MRQCGRGAPRNATRRTRPKRTRHIFPKTNRVGEPIRNEHDVTASASEARNLSITSVLPALVRAMRPRQWVKNILVLVAPFAGGRIGELAVLGNSAIAFVAFSLAASGVYLINDVRDVEADRQHPKKKHRPIAAGIVPPALAIAVAVIVLLGGMAVGLIAGQQLVIVLAVYVAVQLSYCFWLKHQPVIDICIVASGFLLRGIAGGVASSIPLSQWFFLMTGFGSLFMVAGKRYAELAVAQRTGAQIRRSLHGYSTSYLRFVWGAAATLLIMSYALWAFQLRVTADSVWFAVSMAPFVVAVLRYAVDVDGGKAGEPEDIALGDRVLQLLGFAWVITLVLGIYT
ncbi:MAG: decaprenyl-phosphate phosphoribosyltransferase [Sciscionella sp.]|nr:decaprenyl-phosphate phosphoribosyltransferase [Sciscionella sp.]